VKPNAGGVAHRAARNEASETGEATMLVRAWEHEVGPTEFEQRVEVRGEAFATSITTFIP
jgi:hypothetical protein